MDNINNINNPNSYRLTGKYIKNNEIVALQITGINGESKLLKITDIYKLIEKGYIFGCKLIKNKDYYHILSRDVKIAELPEITNDRVIRITARIFKDGLLTGYNCVDSTGKSLNIPKDTVWNMAKNKSVLNATAFISNNKKILRGNGEYLRNLPSIKL